MCSKINSLKKGNYLSTDTRYASFINRAMSIVIDGFILYVPFNILVVSFGSDNLIIQIILFILWFVYNSFMLSSSWNATIGQKILSIKVFDEKMQQLSLEKATLRTALSILSYIFILPSFMLFFTKKRQTLHDYFAKSIVIDDIDRYDYEVKNEFCEIDKIRREKRAKKRSTIRTILNIILILVILPTLIFIGSLIGILYEHFSGREEAYNNSFYKTYSITDYNNTKIDFYNKELEKESKNFIDAIDMYSKFEADVKKDLALNCIKYFIRKYDSEHWIGAGSSYYKNARNKYADTEEKIQKAKDNESYMSHNFYTFDTNIVTDIQDEITQLWSDKNNSICEQKVSVEYLYGKFLPIYVKRFNESRMRDENDRDWLQVLKAVYPKYFKEKRIREKAKKEAKLKAIEDEKIAKIKQKLRAINQNRESYLKDIKEGKNALISAIIYEQNDAIDSYISSGGDVNIKDSYGNSALILATRMENVYAVKELLTHGADMNTLDKTKNYTAFTFLVSEYNVNMEIVKLFLNNNVDINFQYKKSETALTLAAKGCEKFKLVALLLKNGANPDLIDEFGYSTKTGLAHYCSKEKYIQMMTFINRQ